MPVPHEFVSSKFERIRAHTPEFINNKIDRQIERNIAYFATQSKERISQRLIELEREWDLERIIEFNSAVFAFAGTFLSVAVSKRFIALPLVVNGFLFQHAIQGYCIPSAMLRRLGVRTRNEIDAEKYALKALRGDFDDLRDDLDMHARANAAVQAIKRQFPDLPPDRH
jgi:hypothetical protein